MRLLLWTEGWTLKSSLSFAVRYVRQAVQVCLLVETYEFWQRPWGKQGHPLQRCCKMTSWSLSLQLFTLRHPNTSHDKIFGCTRYTCYLTPLCSLWFLERRWNKMQWQVRLSHKTRRRNVASHSINYCYSAHQLPLMMFYWWIKMVSEAIECLASYNTASYKDVSLNKFHN